jgi:hypothetical protein
MTEPIRILPQTAREQTTTGLALLVCAYEDEKKFNANHLEGAISFADFKTRLSSLPKDQKIIFYCA